jgi:mono/diheme cytochrome c family protein
MVPTSQTPAPLRVVLLSVGLLLGTAASGLAQDKPDAQVIAEGKSDFEWHCAACHGETGKGDGPMARILIKPPADLTTIASANGDTFPFWRVYRIIAGKAPVPGHETFQMPDFWKRFSGDEKEWHFVPPHVRILELTHYVESIQEK